VEVDDTKNSIILKLQLKILSTVRSLLLLRTLLFEIRELDADLSASCALLHIHCQFTVRGEDNNITLLSLNALTTIL
jgi:hypothetical protein